MTDWATMIELEVLMGLITPSITNVAVCNKGIMLL